MQTTKNQIARLLLDGERITQFEASSAAQCDHITAHRILENFHRRGLVQITGSRGDVPEFGWRPMAN